MTQIKAEIIADSKNEFGNRITTMIVTFPRYILAEFNTHRMLSKNSASSRAIPFEKMVKSVEENPFIPIAWQKEHKGMQGSEYFTDEDTIGTLENQWLRARDYAVEQAKVLNRSINYPVREGVTKQLCNRLLEPFMWHTVIVTATEWENFFALRCPQYWLGNPTDTTKYRSRKDAIKALTEQGFSPTPSFDTWDDVQWLKFNQGQADIHMMALAEAMWDVMNESTPKELKAGEWHIPFGNKIDSQICYNIIEKEGISILRDLSDFEGSDGYKLMKVKIATAMCARVSYTVVGEESKEPNYENDIKLHDRLLTSGHMSPFEHCAKAMSEDDMSAYSFSYPERDINNMKEGEEIPFCNEVGVSGNFRGFIQYRKTIPNENITLNVHFTKVFISKGNSLDNIEQIQW